jgi:hypothetical protein
MDDATIAVNWWESSGFLNGNDPSLDVDDPYRVSTFNRPVYRRTWRPLAEGIHYPPAPQLHDNESEFLSSAYLDQLASSRQPACLANCSLGGCADPTTAVHAACVAGGCCECRDPLVYVGPGDTCVPATGAELPSAVRSTAPRLEVNIPSERAYINMECVPDQYCQTDLAYFNCQPWATTTPDTDPVCSPYRQSTITPW